MRIASVELSWFRGSSAAIALKPDAQSMVVYGPNGAGKSSFVDALEFISNKGRVTHLAHEYSGKRQEKGLVNTHMPQGTGGRIVVTLTDGSRSDIGILRDGTVKQVASSEADAWDYRRTVLRQNEVADFITGTKLQKYSALLPLLGLQQMEVVAENLHQLARVLEEKANIKGMTQVLALRDVKRNNVLPGLSDSDVLAKLLAVHESYGLGDGAGRTLTAIMQDINGAITGREARSTEDHRLYIGLMDVLGADIQARIDDVRAASRALGDAVDPLLAQKLGVLRDAAAIVDLGDGSDTIVCPACGRDVRRSDILAHLRSEEGRLSAVTVAYAARQAAVGSLCDSVNSVKQSLGKADLLKWIGASVVGVPAGGIAYIQRLNTGALRESCAEGDLIRIEGIVEPIVSKARIDSVNAPPEAQLLSMDKEQASAAGDALLSVVERSRIQRTETVVAFVGGVEQEVRKTVREQSQKIISAISTDIRLMWSMLHPESGIEEVTLHVPEDVDKAIDIHLKFYGVEQESPRMTLSEGNRNSLGLCIFLAMAKREAETDRPVVLDDVVVSLDREHRGMVAGLLAKEFDKRQVLIFTHDRDWFVELRQQMDGDQWRFVQLLPFTRPENGIRWAGGTGSFAEARAQLGARPDAAGNDARKTMDIELSAIGEKLELRLIHKRGEKNERRLAHEFLERIIADGSTSFQQQAAGQWGVSLNAIAALKKADSLLTSWANRASHTFDLEKAEATTLIDACEQALEAFKCPNCKKKVWFAQATNSGNLQCECGKLRWKQ